MSGPKGGGAGSQEPKTKPVPGFAPATGLQSYTARLLAANAKVRTPGVLEWAASGGTLRPDWKIPDFTPREATQLRFVDKQGRPMPGYDPSVGGPLSGQAQAQFGWERTQNQIAAGNAMPTDAQARYGQLSHREEMLQSRLDERGGVAPGLQRRLANVQARKARVGKRLGL